MTVEGDLGFVDTDREALAVLEDLTTWPLMTVDYAAIIGRGTHGS
jgi:hypothetical protein